MGQRNSIVKILSGERFTPFALAKKLGAVAVLESSSFNSGRARYSLLVLDQAFRVEQHLGQVYMIDGDKRIRINHKGRDILDVLSYFADQHSQPHQDFPFPAGGIGFFSYEFAQYCDSIVFQDRQDPEGLPEAAFIFGHSYAIFDHYTDLLYLIGINYKEKSTDLEATLRSAEQKINDLNFNYLVNEERQYKSTATSSITEDAAFVDGVAQVRKRIVAGDLLQGVLSRRIEVESTMPPLELYRRLRSDNPSPYMFYLDFGRYTLLGTSPEVHVKVTAGRATVRPIAGTRKRGADRAEDLEKERELLADPKERAEHLMLIDLGRNDLGRVCMPGTVGLTDYMVIERYSHVMHIVSQVEGDMDRGKSGIDAFRATFPAGTVSGAPKIKAMEIIDSLEPHRRGFYAGAIGYVEPEGNINTCIAIRSALYKDRRFLLQAGAGVVYDSVPEFELKETTRKLGALLRAVGVL